MNIRQKSVWFTVVILAGVCWGVTLVYVFHYTEPTYTGPLSFIIGIIAGMTMDWLIYKYFTKCKENGLKWKKGINE